MGIMWNVVRPRPGLFLKTAVLLTAGACAWTSAHAQAVRGIHDLPSVSIIQPPPAQAQTPAPTPVAPLTVLEGLKPAMVRQAASRFVDAHAASTARIDQIARWHEPICVELVGLPPDQAAKVTGRIESVAESIGVRVMKPGCTANIEIEFTAQPQSLLDKIAVEAEPILGFHYREDLQRLKTVTHPVQAWYATATFGGGDTAGTAFGGGSNGTPNFGAIGALQLRMEGLDSPYHSPPSCGENSRITACLTSNFANVLIVADSQAVAGKNLGTVADYMAMLALSQPRSLDACNALPSVIDLFAKDCAGRAPPDELTPADASYLTALYASDPQAKLRSAQSDITGRMSKILIKANEKARGGT